MKYKLDKVELWVNKTTGRKEESDRLIFERKVFIRNKERLLKDLEMARWVLLEVAKRGQIKFKKYLETIVTRGIRSVYDRPLDFVLEYVIKNRRTQAVPVIMENGGKQIPDKDVGVGLLDILSFTWRVATMCFVKPSPRPVLWLDEPMRDIGGGRLLIRAADLMKAISRREVLKELGFQLIVNTHEPEIASIADRVFRVEHNGECSIVTCDNSRLRKPIKM